MFFIDFFKGFKGTGGNQTCHFLYGEYSNSFYKKNLKMFVKVYISKTRKTVVLEVKESEAK